MQQPEYRKIKADGLETRAYGDGLEIRGMGDGKKKLRGYALKFGQRYDMGWFTEEIAREALANADMADVRALLNHDPNVVLGRTAAGTLSLSIDDTGLAYEIDLPDTQAARDLATSIERGDISQSSWGFTLRYDDNTAGDVWERMNGKDHRTIKAVKRVYDVSPVTFPANPDTTVAKRSHDMQARDGAEMPSPAEVMGEAISASNDCIECLNETVTECTSFAENVDTLIALSPANADLFGAAVNACQAAVDAAKAAILAHTQLIAALNGQRSEPDTQIINQRSRQIRALLASHPSK
jgi:HK97 family phage prohead protease